VIETCRACACTFLGRRRDDDDDVDDVDDVDDGDDETSGESVVTGVVTVTVGVVVGSDEDEGETRWWVQGCESRGGRGRGRRG